MIPVPAKKKTAETAATVRRRVAFRKTQTPSANSLTERLPERKKNLFSEIKSRRTLYLKQSMYKSYDELPLFLNADMVADLLGVSISKCYDLMNEKGFPSLRMGSRVVVPKDKFRQWVEQRSGGGV